MTRLTNDLRSSIHRKIMTGLPVVDYEAQIKELVQDIIIEFAPPQVRAIYADPSTRMYLGTQYVDIRGDNDNARRVYDRCRGLMTDITVRMDPRMEPVLKKGTLTHAIYTRMRDSQLHEKFMEQFALRENVGKRVKINLEAATTIKRLYDVLEPELHHFIPQETEAAKVSLPSAVAPVVDDLKKLGLVVPDVPKASPVTP